MQLFCNIHLLRIQITAEMMAIMIVAMEVIISERANKTLAAKIQGPARG